MKNNENSSSFYRFNNWLQRSVTIKLLSIGILILLLLIPASMIEGLIRERRYARDSAISEVSGKWGNSQLVSGPLLSVPYKKTVKNRKGELVELIEYIHYLPDFLEITGSLDPETRYRGIYDVVVYGSDLKISGKFKAPEVASLNVDSAAVIWKDAHLNLGITDMRGIKKSIATSWNDTEVFFEPGISSKDLVKTGVNCPVKITPGDKTFNFSFNLSLNGSSSLRFLPLGKVTRLKLHSPWTTPKFDGAFLPDQRSIDENGFTAFWEIFHLNRNYPQKWVGNKHQIKQPRFDKWESNGHGIQQSQFGVDLLLPIDQYQKSTRSAKYAIMFIVLTFMILFFAEVLNRKKIHPFQYILIGLALCIFYLLLLSLSEHIGFNTAYIVSSVAIVAMVTAYIHSIFKQIRLTAITAAIIIILYAFLFTTLQLKDYALLMGSIGLFIVMAIIMYLSRKINWYKLADED